MNKRRVREIAADIQDAIWWSATEDRVQDIECDYEDHGEYAVQLAMECDYQATEGDGSERYYGDGWTVELRRCR